MLRSASLAREVGGGPFFWGDEAPQGLPRSVTRPPGQDAPERGVWGWLGPAPSAAVPTDGARAPQARGQGAREGWFASLHGGFLEPQHPPSPPCGPLFSLPGRFLESPRLAGDRTWWEAADRLGILLGVPAPQGRCPDAAGFGPGGACLGLRQRLSSLPGLRRGSPGGVQSP